MTLRNYECGFCKKRVKTVSSPPSNISKCPCTGSGSHSFNDVTGKPIHTYVCGFCKKVKKASSGSPPSNVSKCPCTGSGSHSWNCIS